MSLWLDQPPDHWFQRTATRCAAADRRWAISLHHSARNPLVIFVLILVSWLGDGWVWYATMVALPAIFGWSGWPCTLQMLSVGSINLLVYLCLKHSIGRPRPYVNCDGIRACTRVLDQFSFPSGHTLHAVAYAMIISHHYSSFTAGLWLFAALVAASRVMLGLHYPSDVLAGGTIGATMAGIVLAWP
jgi:undecaprenyl-diphosphatase